MKDVCLFGYRTYPRINENLQLDYHDLALSSIAVKYKVTRLSYMPQDTAKHSTARHGMKYSNHRPFRIG